MMMAMKKIMAVAGVCAMAWAAGAIPIPATVLEAAGAASSHRAATFSVRDTVMSTYPFSDPNPVPNMTIYYPYWRFDGYSVSAEERHWTVVVLENDWLEVTIFPEIGGKVWAVRDKTTGKDILYNNDVVKFRDISMRGPWTSGGIEFNHGIIGHAPTCAHPVEWDASAGEDGSAACHIGALDLLTRTWWTVTIALSPDECRLRTSTLWHNASGLYRPYYTWANSAVKASPDLEMLYPGTFAISHEGDTKPFPVNGNGLDISRYSNQGSGADWSLHIGGSHKGWFGAWWRDEDYGMLHMASRDGKMGRKYYSWSQSRQGGIWTDLLTDSGMQYVEMQSGRLMNQNRPGSIGTPFKQTLFTPYGTDSWDEWWMPVSGIGGVDYVTEDAAVKVDGGSMGLYPLRDVDGALVSYDREGRVLRSQQVALRTAVPAFVSIEGLDKASGGESGAGGIGGIAAGSPGGAPYRVTLNGVTIWTDEDETVDRPQTLPEGYDKESADALTDAAWSWYGMKEMRMADSLAVRALGLSPNLRSALVLRAMICLDRGMEQESWDLASKALATDTYDPVANYIGGVAAEALGRDCGAMDCYEMAAIPGECRSAALTRLAQMHFRKGDAASALEYARKALITNAHNITALEVMYLAKPDEGVLRRIRELDALDKFADFEGYLEGQLSGEELAASVKEELRYEVYLEYAILYHSLGLTAEAAAIVAACPDRNALVEVWEAYLSDRASGDRAECHSERSEESSTSGSLSAIAEATVELVFPFRRESVAPLEWAIANGADWKASYMLAMLKDHLGVPDAAGKLLSGDEGCQYAPFYAYRYKFTQNTGDLERAISLEPEQWRYTHALVSRLCSDGHYSQALDIVGPYWLRHRDNFHIGELYIKVLMATGDYRRANDVITRIRILPYEGQSASHELWRSIKLHLAAGCIDRKQYSKALGYISQSLEWPENLGVGKPYDDLINTDPEMQLRAIVCERTGRKADARESLAAVRGSRALYDSVMQDGKTASQALNL